MPLCVDAYSRPLGYGLSVTLLASPSRIVKPETLQAGGKVEAMVQKMGNAAR
jgi:hypothetical protein